MATAEHFQTLIYSRRRLLRGAVAAAAGGAVAGGLIMGSAAAAPRQLAQASVSYQGTPKGKARCDNCNQWLPPASCKGVAGVISPAGWCTLYAPKS
jgi:hypothetical protein